jgi:carotenoid cleavage dioxygenase-like enzyme
VLDAHDLSPLAMAHFDHRVPPGFHGTWMPPVM